MSADKNRQFRLEKERKERLEEFERQKASLNAEANKDRTSSSRFSVATQSLEEELKAKTVGLQRLEDYRDARKELEEEQARKAAGTNELGDEEVRKKKKKKKKATLSFALDEEEEEEEVSPKSNGKKSVDSTKSNNSNSNNDEDDDQRPNKKARLGKNPSVDTSFLPDRDREEEERKEREELRKEFLQMQEKAKNETIEITYSYWDGSGHRSVVTCKKGDTIATFLDKCRQQFPEIRGVSIDNLMYIKEDLIIPHHYTFYDFIINKARGKSGPLFNFDVHDDVRLLADATVEKDESHAGKVVERTWYNRSKHHFPQSRWEVYDPEKDYGSYTIA